KKRKLGLLLASKKSKNLINRVSNLSLLFLSQKMALKEQLRVFFFALLLLSCPLLQVVRCQSESEVESEVDTASEEGGDLGIIGEDPLDFGDGTFSAAPGIDTVCVFPKNSARLVPAGEETELLVGLKNDGESSVNVIAIKASVHLPFDHKMLVQNLTAQAFNNATLPASAQATFPYIFAVSKYLQPGTFDLVGTVIYEIDQHPYQSTFYNGTIEVVEVGGFLSIESVFLVTLGIALLVLLGLWIQNQIKNLSKKPKRAPKVEVGTGSTDASMDEWLQGTAYTQSLSSKSKKKK
ncbi:TRAP_alpha domain-containing protein, partial [Cephalotus follicularis]